MSWSNSALAEILSAHTKSLKDMKKGKYMPCRKNIFGKKLTNICWPKYGGKYNEESCI